MKRLLAIAALLLASTAAQAQYTFEYGGRTIRIDPDRGTVQIPGVYDNTGKQSKRAKDAKSDPTTASQIAASQDGTESAKTLASHAGREAPAEQAAAPAATAAAVPAPLRCHDRDLRRPPRPSRRPDTAVCYLRHLRRRRPCAARRSATDAAPPPTPAAAVATAPPQAPASLPPGSVQDTNSPVGVWLTEEKEGKVRIEQCGANLCGYSVDTKSNQNGEQVLINMRPGKDQKWSGRISIRTPAAPTIRRSR